MRWRPGLLVLELRLICWMRAAATDLLDAPNCDCMKKFLGSPAIVLGDNGDICMGTLSAVAAANSIDLRGVKSANGHGTAASVQGNTGITAFSLLHNSLIRDCRPNSLHHARILVLISVGWVLVLVLVLFLVQVCRVLFVLVLSMMWMMPAWMALYLMEFVLVQIQ